MKTYPKITTVGIAEVYVNESKFTNEMKKKYWKK